MCKVEFLRKSLTISIFIAAVDRKKHFVDLTVEYFSPGLFVRRGDTATTFPLDIHTDTDELTLWILLPTGTQYKNWRVVRHLRDKPDEPRGTAMLGLIALKTGALVQAEQFLRRALALGLQTIEVQRELASRR